MGAYPTAAGAFPPPAAATDRDVSRAAETERRVADPHLRSSAEMRGYGIEATHGSIGHIDDFLFDDRSWQIRFVVVDCLTRRHRRSNATLKVGNEFSQWGLTEAHPVAHGARIGSHARSKPQRLGC